MTASGLTADEARARNVAAMGNDLGVIYSALWQQLAWLHAKWFEFVVIFGTKESRVTLMNEAAPAFTRIVQDSLWEDVLLHIARLTDPPKSAGRSNLSIQVLPPLVTSSVAQLKVEAKVKEALALTEFARDWRNRHIAHRDLDLALRIGAAPLKEASRLKVTQALGALDDVLNAISLHFLGSTTYFSFGGTHGGAMSLLQVVQVGLQTKKEALERTQGGEAGPTGPGIELL